MVRISSLSLRYIKVRGQTRNCYDLNYDQRSYQNRNRSNSEDRRISFSGRIEYGQNYRDRPRYNQNYRGDFSLEEMCDLQIRFIENTIIEVDTEETIEMIIMIELGVGQKTDNTQTIPAGMTEVVLGLDQVQELV